MKIQRQYGESVIRQPLATNDANFYVHACGPAGSEAALKPNSITLASSELAPNKFRISSEPVRSQLWTS